MPESPMPESPNAESLILGVTDGVAVLTLNRPRAKNALDSDMMRVGMPDFVRRAREDDAIRAVVIAGAGGDFCSGADVKRMEIGRAHVELQSLMRISYAVLCLKKKNRYE